MARKKIQSILSRAQQSRLARTIGVYTLLNFFLRGVSFLITPLFTNYITPEEFGRLNIMLNLINFIAPFISLGITNTIAVDYFKLRKENLSSHISTYFLFSASITFGIFLLFIIFQNELINYFHFDIWFILSVPLLCFFNLIMDTLIVINRNEHEVKKIAYITIFKILLEIGLSIILIVFLKKGIEGRALSLIISTGIIAIFCFYDIFIRFKLSITYNFRFIKNEVRFWGATIVGFLFVLSFTVFDKYIVKQYSTEIELGNYSLATQFGFIILTFSSSLSASLLPSLYDSLTKKVPMKHVIKKLVVVFFLICIVSILSNLIVYIAYRFLISDQYFNSWKYYKAVSVIYGIWSVIAIFYGFIYYYKLEKIIFLLGVYSIIIFLPLQIIGIKTGSLQGLFLAQIVYLMVCMLILSKTIYSKIKIDYASNPSINI